MEGTTLEEQMQYAIDNNLLDLQILIMFLVFEKQVLSMNDDIAELDRYFLSKHNKRMNQELNAYKGRIKANYGKEVYEVLHDQGRDYIVAIHVEQVRFWASRNGLKPTHIDLLDGDELIFDGNRNILVKDLRQSNVEWLGGFHR